MLPLQEQEQYQQPQQQQDQPEQNHVHGGLSVNNIVGKDQPLFTNLYFNSGSTHDAMDVGLMNNVAESAGQPAAAAVATSESNDGGVFVAVGIADGINDAFRSDQPAESTPARDVAPAPGLDGGNAVDEAFGSFANAQSTAAGNTAAETLGNGSMDKTLRMQLNAGVQPEEEEKKAELDLNQPDHALSGGGAMMVGKVGGVYNIDHDSVAAVKGAHTSTVNGRGLWNSWTRNFSTPLLAFLDLLDNAVDAATLTHPGRIYIDNDHYHEQITGMTVINSCYKPIKPLDEVLEIYTSLKGSNAESIGENGVGLKQGCATLSNLSFCLAKRKNRFSMGVLAYELQTTSGSYLPSIDFESETTSGLRAEMLRLFEGEYQQVGDCVYQYGQSNLELGVKRLVKHFKNLDRHGWEQYDYVFALVIDNPKHGVSGTETLSPDEEEEGAEGDRRPNMYQAARVKNLLDSIYQDLPRRYLHIPNSLDVRVSGHQVNFNYWQPRLVELTQCDVNIDKNINFFEDPNWRNPVNGYCMRLYLGFDALRVDDDKAPKTASLYVYSRTSGRLIRRNLDTRGELGLTSGGTEFCQGLTIIVDDHNANLPLNPTKQDIAFGEQPNGETHKRNLYAWLAAATKQYYGYFKDRMCAKQKKLLTTKLKDKIPEINGHIRDSGTEFRTLSHCEFSRFGEFAGGIQHHVIKLQAGKSVVYTPGADTKIRLSHVGPAEAEEALPAAKRRRLSAAKQKQLEQTEDAMSPIVRPPLSGKRRAAKSVPSSRNDIMGIVMGSSTRGKESLLGENGVLNGKRQRRSPKRFDELYGGGDDDDDVVVMGTNGGGGGGVNSPDRRYFESLIAEKDTIITEKDNIIDKLRSELVALRRRGDGGDGEFREQLEAELDKKDGIIKDLKQQLAGTPRNVRILQQRNNLLQQEADDLRKQVQDQMEMITRKNRTISSQSMLLEEYGQDGGNDYVGATTM